MPESELKAVECKIKIHTLGKFFIRQGDSLISESSSRSRRMWEVFKYLLSNRDKSFFPEVVLDNIWPDKDYSDPNTVMRAQMFRLRQALATDCPEASLASNIVFMQGCYRWENKVDCWIDVDEFEYLVDRAKNELASKPEKAIETYNRAIMLYKGEYLPESAFSEWVVPLRTYYHDLYLGCVFELADLYKAKRAYADIIRLCEQASSIDYFEEKIHVRLIEALLAEGQTTRAKVHYNEVTSAMYREMGIKPSDTMKSLYRLIGLEAGSFELDLGTIQEGLKGKEVVNGAYFCDAELFRYFYKLERLRGERSGRTVLLCLLTITNPDYSMPHAEALREVAGNLQEVILDSLRKGDIVTRWNDAQFLMLLPGLNREQAEMVMDRTEQLYLAKHSLNGLSLHKKVESLLPLEGDAHFF
jgi:two-component SAPR family response regulator